MIATAHGERTIATAHELTEALRARGMLTSEAAGVESASPGVERPWYIGLLLGTAGWFAGLFVLVFVFLLFKPDASGSALVVGLVLIGSAWGLFKADRDGAFASQLALALSVAGQFVVLYGAHEILFKGTDSFAGLAAIAIVLQLALVLVMPSRLHRTMSTLFACAAWAMAVRYALWDGHRGGLDAGLPPSLALALAGFAIVWLPVAAALYWLIRAEAAWMAAGRQALMRPVTIGLIAGLAVATLLSHPFESFSWNSGVHEHANWLALWPLLSAIASLGALAGAFALGNRGLMGLCVVAALLHASHFYYAMGTTLLIKSLTMLVMGAALFAGAHYLKRRAS